MHTHLTSQDCTADVIGIFYKYNLSAFVRDFIGHQNTFSSSVVVDEMLTYLCEEHRLYKNLELASVTSLIGGKF